MSSGLQLDVRYHIQWRRHLVNAYEVKAGMVFFAGEKLCDPCLSALEWFVPCWALYKCSDLPFTFTMILGHYCVLWTEMRCKKATIHHSVRTNCNPARKYRLISYGSCPETARLNNTGVLIPSNCSNLSSSSRPYVCISNTRLCSCNYTSH